MAVRYYGVAVGGNIPSVTIGTSTTSSDVELAVDDSNLAAASVSKALFIERALEAIRQAVHEDTSL